MNTLTSKYTPTELYELILWTIKDSGNGGEAFISSTNDLFVVEDDEIFITKLNEVDGVQYTTSKKKLELYDLYLMFELFENVIDADKYPNEDE